MALNPENPIEHDNNRRFLQDCLGLCLFLVALYSTVLFFQSQLQFNEVELRQLHIFEVLNLRYFKDLQLIMCNEQLIKVVSDFL